MATPTIQGLRTCIQALETDPTNPALRQEYVDGLSRLHEAVFHKFTDLLKKDLYLDAASKIVAGGFSQYPSTRDRLLPLAKETVKAEEQFKQKILTQGTGGPYPFDFPRFFQTYRAFAHSFYAEVKSHNRTHPYFFQKRAPHTFRWFQTVLKDLYEKRDGFQELFKSSDPVAFPVLMNWAILKWATTSNETIPECFVPHTEEIQEIKRSFAGLNKECQTYLNEVLLSLNEMDRSHPAYETFIQIGKLKARMERGTERSASEMASLFHALTNYELKAPPVLLDLLHPTNRQLNDQLTRLATDLFH